MKKAFFATLVFAFSGSPVFSDDVPKSLYITGAIGETRVRDVGANTTFGGNLYQLESEFDNAFNLQLGLGKYLNDHWRIEGAYSKSSPKEIDITASTGGSSATATLDKKPEYDLKSYMLNVYRDFDPITRNISPYFGLGVGMTNVKMQEYTTTIASTDVVVKDPGRSLFTYSIKAGASIPVNDRSVFFSELSYNALEQFNEDSVYFDEISAINLIGGFRYKF